MCPNQSPGLADCHGAEFKALYEKYEAEGKARKSIKAQQVSLTQCSACLDEDEKNNTSHATTKLTLFSIFLARARIPQLWFAVLDSQVETGTPYMLFKDHCNAKSNQKNLGTIRCSNLCTEIVEFTAPDEIAVCNLASISLTKLANIETGFDFKKLKYVAKVVTKNLNRVIDENFYPVPEALKSNMRHRPIGIGVQGLADCLAIMRYPFESEEGRLLNRDIFETIYFGACEASMEVSDSLGTKNNVIDD